MPFFSLFEHVWKQISEENLISLSISKLLNVNHKQTLNRSYQNEERPETNWSHPESTEMTWNNLKPLGTTQKVA